MHTLLNCSSFHSFFTHVDNYRTPVFLYLSSKGLDACGDVRTEPIGRRDMSRKERHGFAKKHNRRDQTGRKSPIANGGEIDGDGPAGAFEAADDGQSVAAKAAEPEGAKVPVD